jgi:predicted nucleic acid-binding protein
MPEVIISDTSTLIIFHKIDEFQLLHKVYGQLITTLEIADEFGDQLPNWILVKDVSDKKHQRILETQIDRGEASALALATEYDNVLLLLDDLKARKLAISLNYKVSGALGVIQKARQMEIIQRVKPILDKLVQTDFRIANNIIQEILRLNNE